MHSHQAEESQLVIDGIVLRMRAQRRDGCQHDCEKGCANGRMNGDVGRSVDCSEKCVEQWHNDDSAADSKQSGNKSGDAAEHGNCKYEREKFGKGHQETRVVWKGTRVLR